VPARSAGGRGGNFQCAENRLKNAIGVAKNIVVPEPQDAKTFGLKVTIARYVVWIVRVLAAIDFDDQLSPEAGEVNNVRAKRNLSFELIAIETMRAEPIPKPALGIGHVGSQLLRLSETQVPLSRLAASLLATLSRKRERGKQARC
jgi:hypothetical protein